MLILTGLIAVVLILDTFISIEKAKLDCYVGVFLHKEDMEMKVQVAMQEMLLLVHRHSLGVMMDIAKYKARSLSV